MPGQPRKIGLRQTETLALSPQPEADPGLPVWLNADS